MVVVQAFKELGLRRANQVGILPLKIELLLLLKLLLAIFELHSLRIELHENVVPAV